MDTLTAPRARMLRLVAGSPRSTSMTLARAMWPDSKAWERTTHRHDGISGARGGTMPMKAGRLLRAMADDGLVSNDGSWGGRWSITVQGAKALATFEEAHPA